jgi:hypothetical protein
MADDSPAIELSLPELRKVTGYPAACARPALVIFEREHPEDRRPRTRAAPRSFTRWRRQPRSRTSSGPPLTPQERSRFALEPIPPSEPATSSNRELSRVPPWWTS